MTRRAWAIALGLAAAALVPVWAGRLLPLLDAPTHLGAASIWQHLGDARYGLDRFYAQNTPLSPYSLHYHLLHLLAFPFGLEAANKIFVSAYLLAVPAGAFALLRATGRDPRLALFAFPLAWNVNLLMGFFSNLLGNALLLPALALLCRALDRPSRARLGWLGASGVVLYLAHPLPWIALGLGGLPLVLGRGLRGLRAGALAYAALAPSAALAVWQTWFHRPAGVAAVVGGGLEARWKPARILLREIPTWTMDWWPGHLDEAMAGALLLCALGLVALDLARRAGEAAEDPRPAPRGLLCTALVCFGLYFALPVEMFKPAYWWLIGARLLPLALLFLALAPRRTLGPRATLVLAPVLAIAVLLPGVMTARTLAFNARAAGLPRIAQQIPLGMPCLTLVMSPREDPAFTQPLYRAFHSYVLLWRGGASPYEWPIGFPFRYLRPLPAPPWYAPESYAYAAHGRHWPYVLTWHDAQNRVGADPQMQLVAEDAGFRLFRNTAYEAGP